MIITLRTDNPTAEIGLYNNDKQLHYHTWLADRQLANTLLTVLHQQLQQANADWSDITGLVVYQGPGSFTGLRIGLTVANALAYGLNVPIVAQQGESWRQDGIRRLKHNQNDQLALPHYGAEANITLPKK